MTKLCTSCKHYRLNWLARLMIGGQFFKCVSPKQPMNDYDGGPEWEFGKVIRKHFCKGDWWEGRPVNECDDTVN